ncbi:MAG: hypothetical protein C0183_13855 [Roseiflexus castenholzii]|uniref:hypothetical protein n=1 Tax=Roseiflexus castenholzii TaxID=120962 RepID=UPI000CB3432B|nr:MAG: hypothetical protein C0183_13855 [Roseiflexus castenholzii]
MTRGAIWVALLRVVRTHHLQLRYGLIGAAHTTDALLTSSVAGVVTTSGNTALSQGFAGALFAGHDAALTSSGSMIITAGHDLEVQGGGGGMLLADTVYVADTTIPLVIARNVNASGNTRILLNTPQAIALGLACGAALALIGAIIRRRRGSRV